MRFSEIFPYAMIRPTGRSWGWFLPGENTLVLIFANVSDEPVTTTLDFDAARYGLTGNGVRVISLAGPGGGDPVTEEAVFSRTITFPERFAVVYEVKPNH